MKVEFLKDYQFYLGNDMSKMSKVGKGDSIEVDAETAERWIKKKVAKMANEKVEVEPVLNTEMPTFSNTCPEEEEEVEEEVEKPAPKKRGRKKRSV